MAKDPAFLFYSNDFLSGTYTMTNEQVGMYIRLLCLQHQKGRLSELDMLYICNTHVVSVFDKFTKDEHGFYYNERLEQESIKRKTYSESRKRNISKRYEGKDAPTYVVHMENENENINKDISIYKSISKSRPTQEQVLVYFTERDYPQDEAEQFFNHYEALDWFNGNGMKITNWKAKAESWHKNQKLRDIENGTHRESSDRGKGSIDWQKYEQLSKLQPAE